MNRPPLPPQLVRIAVLTVLIGVSYIVARVLLTPATFGHYGHYRGAALVEAASIKPVFAGAKSCDECHSDTTELLAKNGHKTVACEACHGPSRPHGLNPDSPVVMPPKPGDLQCLRCHLADAARPAKHPQIQMMDHFPGDRCIECHVSHQPKKIKE